MAWAGAGSGPGQAGQRAAGPCVAPAVSEGHWFMYGMHVGHVTWNNTLYSLGKILLNTKTIHGLELYLIFRSLRPKEALVFPLHCLILEGRVRLGGEKVVRCVCWSHLQGGLRP